MLPKPNMHSRSARLLIIFLVFSFNGSVSFCDETFLTFYGKDVFDSEVPELNITKRNIIDPEIFPRNLRVFDPIRDFPDANYAFEKEENVPSSLGSKEDISVASEGPSIAAVSLCRELQAELGKSVSDFTSCAITNARPISICLNCVVSFNETIHLYKQLTEVSVNATKCKDVLFGKDKLEIIETMYLNVVNLWNRGNCYSCYEYEEGFPSLFVMANLTQTFFVALHKVSECFERVRPLHITETDNSNNTCIQCKTFYEHLSTLYDSIVKDLINNQPTEEVCADIADAMNGTRHLWNNQFKCKLFDTSVGYALFVLTGSLSAVPVLFYLAAKALSNAETILLVLPKRKSFVQESAQLQM